MNLSQRIDGLPWNDLTSQLSAHGYVRTGPLLTPEESGHLIELYADRDRFRSRIEMARYRFGQGDYQYFANPLPDLVADLRRHTYPHLAPVANEWQQQFGVEDRFPATLDELRNRCHAVGQTKPTPLMLHYEAGGYNCLHQDLYGDMYFPLQMLVFLNQRGRDYAGGEFLLVEQQLRAQSIGQVITADQGEAVFFTTRHRPVRSKRGWYRANVRHGVSPVQTGTRWTLGIIFHDAA